MNCKLQDFDRHVLEALPFFEYILSLTHVFVSLDSDELVLESGIRESMDDDEEDDDEGSGRRDERDSLDDSEDEDYEQKRYRRG